MTLPVSPSPSSFFMQDPRDLRTLHPSSRKKNVFISKETFYSLSFSAPCWCIQGWLTQTTLGSVAWLALNLVVPFSCLPGQPSPNKSTAYDILREGKINVGVYAQVFACNIHNHPSALTHTHREVSSWLMGTGVWSLACLGVNFLLLCVRVCAVKFSLNIDQPKKEHWKKHHWPRHSLSGG